MEKAASWQWAAEPYWPKNEKILTAAGCLSGDSSRMKGTKKLPHAPMKTKMNTTARPGRMSGTTMRVSVVIMDAPSIHAASSRLTGTLSMKFFVMKMAIGRLVAARNTMVATIESIRLKATKRL